MNFCVKAGTERKVIGTQAPCMFARGKSPLINKNPPHMHLNTIWDSFKGHKRKMQLESCLKTLHSLLFLQGSHVVSNLAPKTFKFQQTQPIQTSLPSLHCCPWSNRQIWNRRMRGNQWPLIRALSLHCNKTPSSFIVLWDQQGSTLLTEGMSQAGLHPHKDFHH